MAGRRTARGHAVVVAALLAGTLVACGGGDRAGTGTTPPTKAEYAAAVARQCVRLAASPAAGPLESAAVLREVRDSVRALPTPPELGAAIRTRLHEPLDRYLVLNEEAAAIVTRRSPSRSDVERSFELLNRADQDLATIQAFMVELGVPQCAR